jgi:SAM-dependent methyltransferase
MNKTLDIYHQSATEFAKQYDALSFERVHQSWQAYWPVAAMGREFAPHSDNSANTTDPARAHSTATGCAATSSVQPLVLDIGAGSGRDALWLAQRGCHVIAVEPAANLRSLGHAKTAAAYALHMPPRDKVESVATDVAATAAKAYPSHAARLSSAHHSTQHNTPHNTHHVAEQLSLSSSKAGTNLEYAPRDHTNASTTDVAPHADSTPIQPCLTQVQWLDDSLPELKACYALNLQFHTILVSAVWMHIAPSERERAFRKMANLLAPGGRLVLTLRYGNFSDGRQSYDVSVDEVASLSKKFGLVLCHVSALSDDSAGRAGIQWQSVVLELPDDGSASLSKIRHIVLNDNKSSTYKLALLRTLVRIADAHPGAVLDRQDGRVTISLGLVALYWIRLFKRLVDNNIQQSSDPAKGLGFVTDKGWNLLTHLTADDFAIGTLLTGQDAVAFNQLMRDTLTTIKAGPVTYIWQGHKDHRLFDLRRPKAPRVQGRNSDHVLIDKQFLASFGEFELSESMWDCLRIYGCWIEPLLLQQWVSEMQKYELNRQQQWPLEFYYHHLRWLDQQHDTALVRKRVAQLRQEGMSICSVWSGKPLQQYDIDHCLPFSYWPNNDLWNLLPASRRENRVKSDRIPSQARLHSARPHILEWWQQAWQTEPERQKFFIEAALSLPNVAYNCTDFDTIFEALQFQTVGIRQRLQVAEW